MSKNEITKKMEALALDLVEVRWTRERLLEQIDRVESATGIDGGYEPELRRLRTMIEETYIGCDIPFEDKDIEKASFKKLKEYARDPRIPKKFDSARLIESLSEKYTQYPRRECFIERIVETLADSEFKDDNGNLKSSVFSTIVKQFVKYDINNVAAIKKLVKERYPLDKENPSKQDGTRHALKYIDDYLIDMYNEKIKEAGDDRRKIGEIEEKYDIILLADDFSKGKLIRSSQKQISKKRLYEFAIAFNMTYYSESEKEDTDIYDSNRDIVKNLFEDYYTASLFDSETGEQENLGDGIDLKNFAETIYLYYIKKGRGSNVVDDKRIKLAENMISSCFNDFKQSKNVVGKEKSNDYYCHTFDWLEIPFELEEFEFEEYIKSAYRNTELANEVDAGDIWKKPNQVTATESYSSLIKKLNEKELDEFFNSTIFDGYPIPFLNMVSLVYDHLRYAKEDIIKGETIVNGAYVSREKLISLYCLAYLNECKEKQRRIKPQKVCNDFCEKNHLNMCVSLNHILEECRYQKFNQKTLFDVIVLCIIYVNLYN